MKSRIIMIVAGLVFSMGSYAFYYLFQSKNLETPLNNSSPCYSLVAFGFPEFKKAQNGNIYMCHKAYAFEYNKDLKLSMWVVEHLKPTSIYGQVERTDEFMPDPKIPLFFSAKLEDYRGSGYDRGHLAPAADFSKDIQAMGESFYLTNMAPQVGIGMNRGVWREIESQVRKWVMARGDLYIITGPVFMNGNSLGSIGKSNIPVPTHFYKVIIDKKSSQIMSFLVPNKDLRGQDVEDFIVSLSKIKQVTGLEFMPEAVDDRSKRYIINNIYKWEMN